MNFIKSIETTGFIIAPREEQKDLSAKILKRYKNIPKDYLEFLQQFKTITNTEDTVWFNSIEDFNEELDTDFSWNTFEQMSLETFEDDDNELSKIRKFWDNHIPILQSVTEYQYMAICLDKDNFGEIVYGVEPEFEEASKVCDSFAQLIRLFENTNRDGYIQYFI